MRTVESRVEDGTKAEGCYLAAEGAVGAGMRRERQAGLAAGRG